MLSAPQYSLALLLVAAVASNGLTDAANLRQQRGLAAMGDDYFSAMLALVNKERAAKGLSALCMNKKLQAAAQRHSNDMAKNNYMAHDGADGSTMSQRITQAGYEWESVAENVAAGQEDVVSVMASWVASPGHYENIMGVDYTMFGTAYAYNKDSTYGYYWTQDFASGPTEACDDGTTTQATEPPTKQEIVTPAPTTPKVETPATVVPGTDIPATKGPVVTPPATTPAPVATPAATTPAPIATPATTTSAPVATPAATTPAPVATPAATTPVPVATPASTTPAPAVTPAATKTPSTSQKDCESNF
ncbi:unnamed protein product [Phytophthora lilii]|uniref:Unnamed protein product n=1 Tax=Phytophthora lilii TaxID=2077276 RepID=A0A9W6WQZ9_9STRA|nr:unnamed protein product [Phytophthora lilii]